MSIVKRLKTLFVSFVLCFSLVSCDGLMDSIETQGEVEVTAEKERSARVTVTFYNSSSKTGKPIYINKKQYVNSKLIIPQQITSIYTNLNSDNKSNKEKYMFNGWVDYEIDPIDTDVEPISTDFKVTEDISLYTCYKIRELDYEFCSEDTLLESGTCTYGETIKFNGKTPKKETDHKFKYTFNGWSQDSREVDDIGNGLSSSELIATGTRRIIYYAVFSTTDGLYTVTWMNGDTQVKRDINYKYDDVPSFNGTNPTIANFGGCSYQFVGWNSKRQETQDGEKDVGVTENLSFIRITEDKTFYTVYQKITPSYSVEFYNDTTLLEKYSDNLGTVPKFSGTNPKKVSTDSNGFKESESTLYQFIGWNREENKTTADSSLLTTAITSNNNGNPIKFFAAYKKTIFGADSDSMKKNAK